MNLIESHNHIKKVNEYLFSLLTRKQLEEFMTWEQRYDHGMSVKKAISMIYEAYHDDEKLDFLEEGQPVDHIYHAIMTLVEAYE